MDVDVQATIMHVKPRFREHSPQLADTAGRLVWLAVASQASRVQLNLRDSVYVDVGMPTVECEQLRRKEEKSTWYARVPIVPGQAARSTTQTVCSVNQARLFLAPEIA